MFINKKAFTLSELLIALAIVGAIAALAIPSVSEDMNRKVLANQLKNISLTIQNVAGDQLVKHATHSLENTDFAKPSELLDGGNFAIADHCTVRSNCVASSYKRLTSGTLSFPEYTTRKLKNGVTIAYELSTNTSIADAEDKPYGIFYVDLNGIDKPNILGRDLFAFRISTKGRIFDGTGNNKLSDDDLIKYCKENTGYTTTCYSVIERNNWKITY